MLDHLKHYTFILASNSPRRKELLAGLDIPFEIRIKEDISEEYPSHIEETDIALFLAQKKSEAYDLLKNELLITADTIVVLDDGQILEKPQNIEDAKRMLQVLSGKIHRVATGVCIRTLESKKYFLVESEVEFDHLELDEIDYYVNKYSPLDKAGAYGVQEWVGYIGVKNIKGSYFNIMGLPVQRLYQELKNFER